VNGLELSWIDRLYNKRHACPYTAYAMHARNCTLRLFFASKDAAGSADTTWLAVHGRIDRMGWDWAVSGHSHVLSIWC